MKKLKSVIGMLLTACMAWSWVVAVDGVSIVLFGEYQYPTKPE